MITSGRLHYAEETALFLYYYSLWPNFQIYYILTRSLFSKTFFNFLFFLFSDRFIRKRQQNFRTMLAGAELGIYTTLGFAFQSIGLETTTASRSAFLLYLNVKFVPFLALFLLGRSISKNTWTSAFLALTGTRSHALRCTVLCSIVLWRIVLCCIVLYAIVLYCTALVFTTLHYTAHGTVKYCGAVVRYIAPYNDALFCVELRCIIIRYIVIY